MYFAGKIGAETDMNAMETLEISFGSKGGSVPFSTHCYPVDHYGDLFGYPFSRHKFPYHFKSFSQKTVGLAITVIGTIINCFVFLIQFGNFLYLIGPSSFR